MHGDEQKWVDEAIQTNWVSTVGANIKAIEKFLAEYVGVKYAVALSSGTSALHLATKLAAEKLYGRPCSNVGTLYGRKVFCSDITFNASVNPVAYENGEAVFIDTEYDSWNMSPEALEKAFELYPDVKLVVVAHLYGTPGKMKELKAICDKRDALIIEDAAESLGAKYKLGDRWVETGALGDYGCISFNGNKIVTGSSGGMFLTDSREDADKVRKWATQSREAAPWYQHVETGYNYRMSNIVAGVLRGQLPYLDEHLAQKRTIWERYERGFADLPVKMNPWDREKSLPNFWVSCITIDEDAMAPQVRSDLDYQYESVRGKSSPQEILDALSAFNAEGRPVWKPMHMQPIHATHDFVTVAGNRRGQTQTTVAEFRQDAGADIFRRGLCLPSDNKMTPERQNRVIEIVRRCFR
jgi:dTDP-4-amino-4,6-dideoxygalactose transaminase